jgi:hypothetical protein
VAREDKVMSAAAIGIVSAVISVVSSLTSAGAQMQATKERRAIGRMEQKAAEEQAGAARRAGELKEKQYKRRLEAFLATQAMKIGASGVEFAGSPLAAMEFSRREAEKDLDLIRLQTQTEVSGWERQARIIGRSTESAYKYGMWGAALGALGGVGQSLGGVGTSLSAYRPSSTGSTSTFTYRPGTA